MRMFKLSSEMCVMGDKMHWVFDCKPRSSSNIRIQEEKILSKCNETDGRRGVYIERLSEFNVTCPTGFALSEFTLSPGYADDEGRLKFIYACQSVIGHLLLPPPYINNTISRAVRAMSLGLNSTLPFRPFFTSETPCTRMLGGMYDALEPHMVTCGTQHVISSFRLTKQGCLDGKSEAGSMHFVFTCIGVGRYTGGVEEESS